MLRTLATFLSLCLFVPAAFADAPSAPPAAAANAGAPKADAPKADAPKADAPKADAPKADAPSSDAPKADAPKADAPKADAAKADATPADPAADGAAVRTVSAANVAPARARLANGLIAVNAAELPLPCRAIGKSAVADSLVIALPARISLASCLSDAKVNEIPLIDGQESIVAIDTAIVPAIELLDDVTAHGDPANKVMAAHAKAQLYSAMTSRMLKTIPAANQATQDAQALRDARRAILESMMTPWREKQLEAHQAVVEIAKQNPQLAKHPIAQAAIADSRQRIAQQGAVATR